MANLNLLGGMNLVESPYIKVQIGGYTFGALSKTEVNQDYVNYEIQYPNYIQNLQVQKINGQVNKYTLELSYPVPEGEDPNFFDKVFSSVSKTRKIVFSYGDMTMPSFIYKDEEAIITKITQNINVLTSRLLCTAVFLADTKETL